MAYYFRKPSKIKRYGKEAVWIKSKRLYGEDFRIIHWAVPLVTYWNRVPPLLSLQWHMSFMTDKKGKFDKRGRWPR